MTEESINDDHLHDNFAYSIYKMLVYMGVDPSLIAANIETEDTDQNGQVAHILLGIPNTKVGISVERNVSGPFIEDGWFVSPSSIRDLEAMHRAFKSIEAFVIEHKRRSTMETVKQTSRHEQWLIDAIVRKGLPIPERNFKLVKDDGKELTTPDMAWPEIKVAFFVDGLWWHQSMDDSKMIKGFLEDDGNKEYLMEHERTRAEKDASIRSEMQLRGWKVLSCTDRDLENHQGIQSQVANIEKMITIATNEMQVVQSVKEGQQNAQIDKDESLSLSDFL